MVVKRGALVDGVWTEGAQVTNATTFPNEMQSGHSFHLYAAVICPFAHSANFFFRGFFYGRTWVSF